MKKRLTILMTIVLYSSSITISASTIISYLKSNTEKTLFVFQENQALNQDVNSKGKTEISPVNEPSNSIKIDTVKKNDVAIFPDSKNVNKQSNYNNFFLSLNYGLGYRTAGVEKGTSSIEKNFQDELRSGNSFQIKTGYKPNQNSYYGLIYSKFSSSTSLNDIAFVEPNGFQGSGSTSQKNAINYFGVVAGWTLNGFLKNDIFNFDLSLGYINFSEERKFENTYIAKGGNLGISTDISYYFGVNKNFKIGPTFSFNGGAINKYNVNSNNGYSDTVEFDENTFLSLYRIDSYVYKVIVLKHQSQ